MSDSALPAALPARRFPGFRRFILRAIAIAALTPIALTLFYRFMPVPLTPLMIIRLDEGRGIHKDWVSRAQISRHLQRAVIAGEDNLFCDHNGFDWEAVGDAIDDWRDGNGLRGASTISMQTAKNLFLWPRSDWARKMLEAPLTLWIEFVLPKERILEVYLNVAEWAPGVYGAEAAARHYFKKSAAQLTAREAALMAAVLPAPRRWSASNPSPRVALRALRIQTRMGQLGPLYHCLS